MVNKTIKASAVIHCGKVFTGKRHHNCIHKAVQETDVRPAGEYQGFVDEDGNYYNRIEAAELALRNGQVDKLSWPPYLYSEDLW